MIAAAALAATAAMAAAPTPATTLGGNHPRLPQMQAWVASAAKHVPLPAGRVEVSLDARGGRAFVRIGEAKVNLNPDSDRATVLHELGHVYEHRMPAWARDAFLEEVMAEERDFWAPGGNSPHEQFAEAYSIAARGYTSTTGPRYIGYGLYMGPKRMARFKALLRRVGPVPVATRDTF